MNELGVSLPTLLLILFALLVLFLSGVGAYVYLALKKSEKIDRPGKSLDEIIPESIYTEVDGISVHYVQVGEGPDIVLLHGIGASLFIWRFLTPFLQARFRVTAVDIPGFGKSSKDTGRDYGLDAQAEILAAALSKIGIDKAFLVGSSMGGAISLWMAKRFPERFDRLTVMSPSVDTALIPGHVKHFAVATPIFRRAMNRRVMKVFLSRVLSRRELITDAVVDAYLEPFLDEGSGIRAFWSATAVLSDKRLPHGLKDVRSRVQIIYGKRDLLVSLRSMRKLQKLLPNASLILHESGGHHIMEDEPEWVAQEIKSFFDEA
jgi:pimeloyl-ACP methyl ester carboxylesterase